MIENPTQTNDGAQRGVLTSRLGAHGALDVIGAQDRLFDLAALHQVEGHHEGLQSVASFSQEDHLEGGSSRFRLSA